MPTILAVSRYSEGGRGEYPCRYVVLDWGPDKVQRYSRSLQVNDGKHKNYFIYDHYYSTFAAAFADAVKSVQKDHKEYSKGNPSHIPFFGKEPLRILGRK